MLFKGPSHFQHGDLVFSLRPLTASSKDGQPHLTPWKWGPGCSSQMHVSFTQMTSEHPFQGLHPRHFKTSGQGRGLGICFSERSLDTVATVTKPKKLWAVMALLWQQERLSRACQGPFRNKTCYGLHVKCPSQAQCANTWSSADRAVWRGCEPLGGGL